MSAVATKEGPLETVSITITPRNEVFPWVVNTWRELVEGMARRSKYTPEQASALLSAKEGYAFSIGCLTDELKKDRRSVFLATDKEGVVIYAIATLLRTREGALLESVVVTPKCCRTFHPITDDIPLEIAVIHGIGTKIIRAVMSQCQVEGYKTIQVNPAGKLVPFFTKVGFTFNPLNKKHVKILSELPKTTSRPEKDDL